MSRTVYENKSQIRWTQLVSPLAIVRSIIAHKEVLVAFTYRDFQAAHRGTILGLAWSVISPLIMLAIFTLVFGYIFRGRFNLEVEESPIDYALALFVGLAFFNLISMSMSQAPGLMRANSTYVKTASFPLEIIPIASVLTMMISFAISLGLCIAAYVLLHGQIHVSIVGLIPLILSIFLIAIGVSWFLSTLGVFLRDCAAIVPPISLILMFVSSVFFPIESVPSALKSLVRLNPLATIIDEARASLLWGRWVDPWLSVAVLASAFLIAILGYAVFVRTKHAFADVL